MATVLDELVIRLGLDGATFANQVQQTQSTVARMGSNVRREASTVEEYLKKAQDETGQRMKQVGDVGQQISQQFSNVKNNVLGFLGVIAGAYGLQQFASNIIHADAALGNFAKTLGIDPAVIATWEEMGKRVGSSIKSVRSAFVAYNKIKTDIQVHGTSTAIPALQAIGVNIIDPNTGKMKEAAEFLKDLGEAAKRFPAGQMREVLGSIGIPPDLLPLLMKGRAELTQMEEAMRALGVATAASAEKDQEFLNQLADIQQVIKDIGRTILGDLLPPLGEALKAFRAWTQAHKEIIAERLGGYIKSFTDTLGLIPERFKDWETAMSTLAIAAGPFFIAMAAGFGPITAAVVALTFALTALKKEMDPKEFAPDSPFWRGMSEAEQLQYPNSPASIKKNGRPDGGSGSWLWDQIFGKKSSYDGGGISRGGASEARQAAFRDQLAADPRLGISVNAAAGLTANANAESGIRGINENNNGPGFGFFQWTNTQGSPRRTEMESFSRARGLDPASDAANYEFMVHELQTKYPGVLAQLRRGDITATQAAEVVARGYVVPPADKIAGHVAGAEGIARLPRTIMPAAAPQALPPPAASTGATTNNTRTSSVETHVNGPITVHTAATDATGVARGLGAALQRYAYVPQVNAGLA